MPLYFFHLRDGGDLLIDAEGIQLSGVEAARAFALTQARDIISHDIQLGTVNLAQRIDVVDEDGALVCSLNFTDAVDIQGLNKQS
jgi:hypothetical protein